MVLIVDFHIHSKYSRATSSLMTVEHLSHYAKIKGISVLGTGDFTHPKYLEELKTHLEYNNGIYEYDGIYYILTTEVSNVFKVDEKTRKIHNVILAPDFDTVEQINEVLGKYGDLSADGRPTLELSCIEMMELLVEISRDIEVIPAHVWTPWFSLFGSHSGFDSVEECFGEYAKYIHALETGLSSDPEMNWAISDLDKYILVSNSDSHSPYPWRLGREANVLSCNLDYYEIVEAFRTGRCFEFTIEVDPSYGKYHFDGHRKCDVVVNPLEDGEICPVCGKKLTIGVLHRVLDLSDRTFGYVPDGAIPFKRLLPFGEIIQGIKGFTIGTKRFWDYYNAWIQRFGNEFNILLNVPYQELSQIDGVIAKWVIKNREGKIRIRPGYDGVYGEPVFSEQGSITDFI